MPVIALCNQKGGSGKTTVAVNLAQGFGQQGRDVLLLDLDPQRSASDWTSVDPDALGFDVMETDRRELERRLPEWRQRYDLVVIDCPPQYAEPSAVAIRLADLVLVPVQPSPLDFWATQDTIDLIEARQQVANGSPRAAFVVSRAVPNSVLQRSLDQGLAEHSIPTLASGTTQRTTYIRRALTGHTVFQGGATIARREIEAIRDEIEELIND